MQEHRPTPRSKHCSTLPGDEPARRAAARSSALLALLTIVASCGHAPLQKRADTRVYDFRCTIDVPDAIAGDEVRVWIPVPLAGDYQECSRLHPVLRGGSASEAYDALGNRILHVRGRAPMSIDFTLRVRRFAATPPRNRVETGDFAPNSPWLASTERAPLDEIRRIAVFATNRKTNTIDRARVLFDHAVDRLRSFDGDGGVSDGRLEPVLREGARDSFDRSLWLCSALRSLSIPSYLEHGYSLHALEQQSAERGQSADGGHSSDFVLTDAASWLRFEVPGMRFLPADPARALEEPLARNQHFGGMDGARIRLSRGRDLRLVPPQKGPPLPRFVRPYAEADGEDVSARLELRISARRIAK